MPGSWSKFVRVVSSGVSHFVGETGLNPRSIKLAIVAEIGPRTISHLFFAGATILYALTQLVPMPVMFPPRSEWVYPLKPGKVLKTFLGHPRLSKTKRA